MKKLILIISCILSGIAMYAAAPNWQVSSSDFQYSMEVFAAVEVDGTELSSANDLLAAFVGSECRGVVQSTDNPFTGKKTFFLMAYANTANETLNYKAYDAVKGQIIELKNTVNFETNSSLGSIAAPYVLSNEERTNGLEFITLNTQENTAYGSSIGYFIHYVNGDAVSSVISIESINDYEDFAISGDSVVLNTQWNYETKNSYHIKVTSSAESGSISKDITINIADVNESPTALYLDNDSIDENIAIGTVVGTLSVDDEDTNETFTYSLSEENAFFTIENNQLITKANVNYEFINVHPLNIRAEDKGGNIIDKDVVITVNNVNDAPTLISLSADSIPAGLPEYMTVGYFKVEDEDEFDTPTLSLVNEEYFILNPQNNHLISAQSYDIADGASKSIRIKADDGNGGVLESDFEIKIVDKGYTYTEKNVNVMFTGTDVYTHIFDAEDQQITLTIKTLDNYGRYHISSNSVVQNYDIYTVGGQLISKADVKQYDFDIDISAFEVANYIINIYTEHGSVAEKLSLTLK